jgi:predicted NBD/HSP70 family sugar kinase
VTRITQQQLLEGLLVEEGTTHTAIGRRPKLLRINSQASVTMGLHLGATATVAVADLRGRILREAEVAFAVDESMDDGIQRVIALINDLRGSLSGAPEVRGIGIGVPSIVNADYEEVVWGPGHGWQSMAFAKVIQEATGLQTFVENDVNLAALGELQSGAADGVDNLIVLMLDTGVGAALIVNGELHRGFRGAAGEVGYMFVADSFETPTGGRPRPRLEDLISSTAIVNRVKAALREQGRAALDDADTPLTCQAVFAAARRGDEVASAVCASVTTYLARAIVNIATVLNPELVVLAGQVVEGNDDFVAAVGEQVATALPHPLMVRLSASKEKSVLHGAIALALERTSNHLEVRKVPSTAGASRRRQV